MLDLVALDVLELALVAGVAGALPPHPRDICEQMKAERAVFPHAGRSAA